MEEKFNTETPMMRQFLEVKSRYKKEVLFFRMGDFYEMFLEDAIYAARVLDIALTRRQDKIPMCGIPYHSMRNYVHPILESGRNIAICEQTEDPKTVSGRIVSRDVVRILTPGTIFEEELLQPGQRNLIASAVHIKDGIQFAICDVSTGEIWLEESDTGESVAALISREVVELVTLREEEIQANGLLHIERNYPVRLAAENEKLVAHNFKLASARPLELTSEQIKALAVFFRYLGEVAPKAEFLFSIHREQLKSAFMKLDESAIRTLELFQDQSGSNKGSLLRVVNQTETTSGLRLLRDWLQRPLLDIEQIEQRYNIVESFLQEPGFRSEIKKILSGMGDIERILQNLGNSPKVRHLGSIRDSLANIGILIKKFNDHQGMHHLQQKWKSEDFLASLHSELEEALLNEELPPVLDERRFLKPGYSNTLDDFLKMTESAANVIQEFEQKEKEKTGITTLKVRYNRVVGYFIEVSKGQLEKVPPEYKRRQTLVNGERYESEELKQLEENILSARENVIRLQSAIFEDLCGKVLAEYSLLMSWARKIAELDVLVCFALVAEQKRYIRPLLVENGQMDIKNARHPVVESLFRDEIFVPNDVELNNTDRHLILLTGPNMAGKSTYIRQIGLLQIMAQAGCFVPAESAVLPLTDRIFTRIGAYDRLHKGESTFYVEMSECARIFQHFTEHSLILLDEVGRGTSTFDGISIARAMIEFLNSADGKKPRTLFATHYSELSELIEPGRGIIGMTVEVLEKDGKVIFLRKIREGVANRSYGIQVAQMAGLPESIVERAKMLLNELEDEGIWKKEPAFTVGRNGKNKSTAQNSEQIDLFGDQ